MALKLIDQLRAEHVEIEAMLGSLRAFVDRRLLQPSPAEAQLYLRYFFAWAGGYHHVREEEVLFDTLHRELELKIDKGPLHALAQQHRTMARQLEVLAPLLTSEGPLSLSEQVALQRAANEYVHTLLRHIDAENSVLLVEAEARLAGRGLEGLEGRPATRAELSARVEGLMLLDVYPPLIDRKLLRGEGCVHCPDFGTGCQGIELEWWSEAEWEDFFARD